MSNFETGASNWQTNEIILTMNNDSDMHHMCMSHVHPFYIFADHRNDFAAIGDEDIEHIDFGFIRSWFEERISQIEKEAANDKA